MAKLASSFAASILFLFSAIMWLCITRTSRRAAGCGRSRSPIHTSTPVRHSLGHSHTHRQTLPRAIPPAPQSAGFSDTQNTCKLLRNSASQQRAHSQDSWRCGSCLSTSRPSAAGPPRAASPHGARPRRAPSQIPCQSEPHRPELRRTAGFPAHNIRIRTRLE